MHNGGCYCFVKGGALLSKQEWRAAFLCDYFNIFVYIFQDFYL